MKQLFTTLLSGLLLLVFSCHNANRDEPPKQLQKESEETNNSVASKQGPFVVNPDTILIDFMTWYNYTYDNIHLAQDFVGLNADSVAIHKADFLTKLETGNFVPLIIKVENGVAVYKLFKLQHSNQDIQATIKQLAKTEIEHFKIEGTELPDYEFADLNGKTYSKVNTKGNILLLKSWFINCVACVKEFPELNRLVDKYHDKTDLLFVSLAIDPKKDLVSFLKKKQFKYAIVPDKGKYMTEKLEINVYPTHILVDKKGKIMKVTNSVEDIIPFLEKEIGKSL